MSMEANNKQIYIVSCASYADGATLIHESKTKVFTTHIAALAYFAEVRENLLAKYQYGDVYVDTEDEFSIDGGIRNTTLMIIKKEI